MEPGGHNWSNSLKTPILTNGASKDCEINKKCRLETLREKGKLFVIHRFACIMKKYWMILSNIMHYTDI